MIPWDPMDQLPPLPKWVFPPSSSTTVWEQVARATLTPFPVHPDLHELSCIPAHCWIALADDRGMRVTPKPSLPQQGWNWSLGAQKWLPRTLTPLPSTFRPWELMEILVVHSRAPLARPLGGHQVGLGRAPPFPAQIWPLHPPQCNQHQQTPGSSCPSPTTVGRPTHKMLVLRRGLVGHLCSRSPQNTPPHKSPAALYAPLWNGDQVWDKGQPPRHKLLEAPGMGNKTGWGGMKTPTPRGVTHSLLHPDP